MRRVGLIILLLLSALSVSAVNFDVNVFPSERTIKLNETASFEIELEHDSPVEELFEVFSNDVTWDVRPEKVLRVNPGISLKTRLVVRPLNLNPGAYNLPVVFKRTGSIEQDKKILYIEILSPLPDKNEYLPAVRGVATIDDKVDPRQGMTIKLSLENQNRLILDKVDVKVRSSVVNKDYSTSLGPLEKKTLTFSATLDPITPPQKDSLQISILVPGKEKAFQFDLFPIAYEVLPYGAVIPSSETESSFMKSEQVVTLINQGNKKLVHMYRVPAWFAKQWFISGSPAPSKEKGGLVWEVPLEPGASAQLVVTYNYRPLFWLFLLALIMLVVYFVFRSPVVVRKSAKVLRGHEGGITELKVVVELVNRSSKPVKKIRVMDLAPTLADVVKEFKHTILAPSKVSATHRGTLVSWDIDFMEPKEHRILVYKMKTKLGVVGGLTLPVTAVHFHVDGNIRETVSNKPEIDQAHQ